MSSGMEHKTAGGSKRRAALALASFLLGATWIGSSGLKEGEKEHFSPSKRVQLELGYRGLCSDVSVSLANRPLPLISKEIGSGLARLSLDLSEGEHAVTVHFESHVPGLKRDYPMKIVVDKKAPALTVSLDGVTEVNKDLVTSSETLQLKLSTDRDARVFLREKELDQVKGGEAVLPVKLSPGWNLLLVSAVDRAGNRSQIRHSVFRDVDKPEVVWKTAPDHVFSRKQARVEVEILDDGKIVGVSGKVDGEKAVTWNAKGDGRWVGVTPDLHEGFHSVEVQAVDLVGNVVTGKRQVVIDSTEELGGAVLGLGARGKDVKVLNERLMEAGFLAKGTVSSIFSKETEQALKALQRSEGFQVTGLAGELSLAALGPRIYINLSSFSLVLDRPGKEPRRWAVASGSQDHPTPTGRFVVWEKVDHPTWLPPDSEWAKEAKPIPPGPDNPLGTRWIGFDWGEVGIHGTNAPWTVGSATSHGCLRMVTEHVEELYELVEVGTPVVVLGGWEDDPIIDKYWPREEPGDRAALEPGPEDGDVADESELPNDGEEIASR